MTLLALHVSQLIQYPKFPSFTYRPYWTNCMPSNYVDAGLVNFWPEMGYEATKNLLDFTGMKTTHGTRFVRKNEHIFAIHPECMEALCVLRTPREF